MGEPEYHGYKRKNIYVFQKKKKTYILVLFMNNVGRDREEEWGQGVGCGWDGHGKKENKRG